ncbi:MAG: hypothetical protein AVDCRST_MAG30-3111 [uncultured Solirubrobacteraceae bacterium]|uniref:3-oxoacyl-[acyl-carrier protein] reductase n=1 Tax=uncultured Solirubrobacteraceae bacterium TaxID=1162706 RepID=A0A6J4TGN4_9ACTN|nr:MAG: hypothetical protein AVDCRST_MAG30-3111 [uncultured Solirubrobacteraceae bacterium]
MPERALGGLVVAITGGARGIGRATAEAASRAGMKVAIGDLDAARTEAAAAEIGGSTAGFGLDVTDPASFAAFLDGAEARLGGPVDVLVNNAGVLFLGPYAAEDPAHTRAMLDVNLGGVLTGSRLALARFGARGQGHLVNVASSAGQIGVAGGATYAATKHAVVGLTRALRAEVRGTDVRTTLVLPGVIGTEMTTGFAKARATRVLDPGAVGAAIVRAVATGSEEVFVPRELGLPARLVAGLPPRASDAIKRALRADGVMGGADRAARAGYESRAAREGTQPGG